MTPARSPRAPRPRAWWVVIGALVALTVPTTLLVLAARGPDGPQRVEFVVPRGTAARQAQGERIEILPALLQLTVGDHLVIRNEDDADHSVGIFTVRAHETLDQPFPQAREYQGICTLHGSGQIKIVVSG